ncbi:N-6 DNA methylase [Vibrio crassostreae]|uniref:N-6 DNA methylase n=1 Tax=Vibrio crassostreae TaxID=246167 RepID=UPI000638EBC2|nr:N-6 DNA methylase [Vibrio crassostreae]TCU02661.1 type I restriction modification DNA specificity protein [Vibrio crassostreae]CAK2036855.1 type I restriction enzyme M protein [Vibrio crassostreae]CAK3004193.1 type I restriction enzyme M protein [Vibrio crassostreae]CDS94239.1 Restriction enzyme BgcI subunit alpha (Includes: Adenine-specific methyltransferase activity) (modular protein) [Vibrio crassostreae]
MAKKEVKTDYWVKSLLDDASLNLEPQGSSILEINSALKTASKSGTGKVGFPEFVGVIKDFLIVIEDKAELAKHVKLDKGLISSKVKDVKDYAINGALFYGKHLAKNTTYKKVIAFGISGDEKKHRISPVYIDETEYYRELPDVESFIVFNEDNIDEYYVREILKEETDEDKEISEILKDAAELHEDLRNYGSLKDIDKPLVVSGILLALREAEFRNFSLDELTGDTIKTDGEKIFDAISSNLIRANVSPEVKKDKILSQFSIIKNTKVLNEKNDTLGKTPLRHYAEFLNEKIYRNIRYVNSSEDYLGRFYGEFMSYSGGDGQTLGIVLTPKHIADLFCDLTQLTEDDVVFDPCCGTGGFLVAAMHHMLAKTDDEYKRKFIKQKSLHGLELQPYMFTIATTNMILRGDGKSNLINENFLKQDSNKLQLKQSTIGMMNPPYSQGSKQNPDLYELSFTEHLLDSLSIGARAIVIVPQSSMTGKSQEEKSLKQNILKNHTLEGVITLNGDTFYGVGTLPCIAIFTSGEPHPKSKISKFINFKDDGFIVKPHIGLVETEQAKDKKQHLLDVWFNKIEAETNFCVSSTVEASDEWLHGYYYFNDDPAVDSEFEKVIEDYLEFEFSMFIKGKENLLPKLEVLEQKNITPLEGKIWKEFFLTNLFTSIQRGKRLKKSDQVTGDIPYVSSTAMNNGVDNYISNRDNVRIFENCLTIANSGSVGASFYHEYEFVASDHVTHLKNEDYNKYIYLFISGLTNRLSEKYNFNREINDPRISREKIVLPIGDNGLPDFNYMEQYIKNLMIYKYKKYNSLIEKIKI